MLSKPDFISSAIKEAQDAFWSSIKKSFPQITTGDLSPDEQTHFTAACLRVVLSWSMGNMNTSNPDAESTLYKLRAECLEDIHGFQAAAKGTVTDLKVQLLGELGDCEATFASPLSLKALRMLLSIIPDAHVMLQTLQPANSYTGDRDYTLQ